MTAHQGTHASRRPAELLETLERRVHLAADLPAVADAYVRDGSYAGSNFGQNVSLMVKRSSVTGNSRESYLRFNIADVDAAAGQTVKLRLYGRLGDTSNTNLPVALHAVSNTTWGESEITWNTRPLAETALDTETITGTTAAWYEWDVTNYVVDEKTNGQTSVAFVLKSPNTHVSDIFFDAEEGASNDPVLRVSDAVVQPPSPPPPTDATVTVPITTASYVRGGNQAKRNFGSSAELDVRQSSTSSNVRETFLRFDMSGADSIDTAKLRLYGGLSGTVTGGVRVNAYSTTNSWTESGITYNNRPSTGSTVLSTATVDGTAEGWYEWDLTSFLQAEKAAGRNVVSIAMKSPVSTAQMALFNSDDATGNRPALVVTEVPPPPPPSPTGRPVSVTVNYGDPQQTVEGFGSAMIGWSNNVPEYENPAFYDAVAGDLGASMARIPIWPTLEVVNDDQDPNHFNWAGFDSGAVARTLTFLQRLQDRGVNKFMATVWTPPGWMKTNGSVYDGGMIRPDQRDEFAEYIAAFAIIAREQYGIEMTAVSLQNEPLFVQWYESGVVTPEQFRELIRTVRRKLDAEGFADVKIVLPEDVNSSDRFDWYVAPTMNDPETREAVGALASHGSRTDHWSSMGAVFDKYEDLYGTPSWLTEASGHTATWDGAMALGTAVHDALVRGDASAYLYWQISEDAGESHYSLMVDGVPTSKYHVVKHFYRYVRPDAVRFAATTSDAELRVASFKHPTSGAVTHVLINTATTAADVAVNLGGASGMPATYKQYRTSSQENHVRLEDVAGGGSFTVNLPASSIVTLYSGPDLTTPTATSGGPLPAVQNVVVGPYTAYDSAQSDALRQAVMGGELAKVQSLIAGGANVNAASNAGWTALHVAAASPYAASVSIINELLNAGAQLTSVTGEGWTPLHVAAANGTTANGTSSTLARDKVNALLAGGATAQVNALDNDGRTPLHWAGFVTKLNLGSRTEDATVVNALLAGGADKTLLDAFGKTARDYALVEGNGAAATALA